MTDYMKEAERLADEYGDAVSDVVGFAQDPAGYSRRVEATRAALLAHIQRGAVPEGDDGKRVLREVFALCEDTETKCSDETGDFARGRRFEAKGIARAIGAWYQEEFCGRAHMGEPAAPVPDRFRAAAKMMAVNTTSMICSAPSPAEVPMPEPVGTRFDGTKLLKEADVRTYGAACRATGEAAGYARGRKEAEDLFERAKRAEDALRELVALEDMRLRVRSLHERGHGTDYEHYHKSLPKAWDAARAALSGEVKP